MNKTNTNSLQSLSYYTEGILNGDITVLSKAITLVESTREDHHALAGQILDVLMPHTGKSFRLGVTGVPGVGKSTFIESFGLKVIEKGHRLAVLAVDPSSVKSGGSILGDKTRMDQLSTHQKAFIRPSPSGSKLGGVTRTSYETILLCEAAGFDFIIVETVGVGQSEIAVSKITDFFLLLMLAGAGDQLQGIKRGIMEMADGLVITKADGDNLRLAKVARAEYAQAMHFLQAHEGGWSPSTQICSAMTGEGLNEVLSMIEHYRLSMQANTYFDKKRKMQLMQILKENLNERLLKKIYQERHLEDKLLSLEKQGIQNPFREAEKLSQ